MQGTLPTHFEYLMPQLPDLQKWRDTSFHARKCKRLHVTLRVLYSTIMKIFYRILAFLCGLLRKKNAQHRFYAFSKYHAYRSHCAKIAYRLFGKSLIEFGLNTSGVPAPILYENTKKAKIDALKLIYKEHFDKLLKEVSTGFPIDKALLTPRRIDEGICWGISLAFIALYQNIKMKGGGTTRDYIKMTGKYFKESAPALATLAEIFHIGQETIINEKCDLILKELNDQIDVVKNTVIVENEKIQSKIQNLQLNDNFDEKIIDRLTKIQQMLIKDFKEKSDNLKNFFLKQIARLACSRINVIAKIFNLLSKKHNLVELSKNSKKTELEQFYEEFNGLPSGEYLLKLGSNNNTKTAHAYVYIKDKSKEGFLHEPNLGSTIISENHAKQFLKIAKATELRPSDQWTIHIFQIDQKNSQNK